MKDDACELCGCDDEPGNLNNVCGVLVCDYCHAAHLTWVEMACERKGKDALEAEMKSLAEWAQAKVDWKRRQPGP